MNLSLNQNVITRRHFVHSTLRTAAGLTLGAGVANECLAAGRLSPPMAVFSKVYQELKLDFEQSAEVTAAAGLDGIDCPVRAGGEIPPEQAADQMPLYAEALRRHNVRMLLLTTGIQGVSSPHARDILSTGKTLGVRFYRLGYWSHAPDKPVAALLSEIQSKLEELAAMNTELGVCGVLQNHSAPQDHSRRNAGCDLVEMHEIVKGFNPDQIGVAFDLGHAIVEHGDQWREHFERLKPHIRLVYIKDVQRPSRFVPFGEGEFRRTGFFKLLAQMDYRAPLSIHIEYDWAPPAGKSRAALLATLQESKRVLGQWLGASG
jgi:sugar phosphate isomerase/epimerase